VHTSFPSDPTVLGQLDGAAAVRQLFGSRSRYAPLMSGPVSTSAGAGDQLRRLENVTDRASSHLDVEDLLDELLDRVREQLQVDTAAVLLLDRSSPDLVVTAAKGIEEELRQGVRIPLGKGFAGRVAADRQPVIIDEVGPGNVLNPILLEKGIRSLLGVPMLAGGTVLGVLHVGSLTPRRFTDDDVALLQLVADGVALSVQGRLSIAERAAAAALQRSLLPARLPSVPGLELAARYVPGEATGVGGDWYDVFVLPTGWIGVVMGDVAGRGLPAAVVMGRLRSALRAYALEGSDPAEVIGRLDRKVLHFEPQIMATVLYAMVDPSRQRLLVSSAGHPMPVLGAPGRPTAPLAVPVDPPIGVRLGLRRRTTTIELPPGGVVCLYTDGLVERRDRAPDAGLERLCLVVGSGSAEAVCATVMGRLVGTDLPGDDIAVLVLRRTDTAPD
jgi:putative methionine-R-sulfoxide reductase with GAF domain